MATLGDSQIHMLINEVKPVPVDFRNHLIPRLKRGHLERDLTVLGRNGSSFRLIVRQASMNLLDFSVVLAYALPTVNRWFRLRRYNGIHGEHTNRIEGNRLIGFHIHMATARYQDRGMREDSYAEATDRYSTIDGAIDCLTDDCNLEIEIPPGSGVQTRIPGMG